MFRNAAKKLIVTALAGAILVTGFTPVTAEAKTGLTTSGGYTYYYKNNRKVKNTSKTVNGRKYYFSSKGRGFISTGSSSGNKAVAYVFDHVSFSSSNSRGQKLRKVYDYIASRRYTPADTPSLSSSRWVGTSAYNMVKYGDAKCYNYAALTGLCARALGYSATIVTGKANRSRGHKKSEHAWVLVGGRVLDTCYDAVNGKSGDQYYYRTYRQIKRSEGSSYSAQKRF